MSFTLVVRGMADIDLGNTIDVLAAFATFGRLEPGLEFQYLHGLADTNEEPITPDDLRRAQSDARRFLDRHGSALDDGALDLLDRILVATHGSPTGS
jgi:hypothetical protein